MGGRYSSGEPARDLVPPAVRSWLYGVAVSLGGAAVLYGWLTADEIEAWRAVAEAVLVVSTGTATAYRPTREP